jgi:hypothetical protein
MARSSSDGTFQSEDEFLRLQPEAVRRDVAGIWAMRAGLELAVSAGYAIIIRELLETGAERPVLELCCDAARDEVTHSQLCLDLAERLDGERRQWPKPASLHVPQYPNVPKGPLLTTLHLVAMSCLNETIACVRLLEAIQLTECSTAKEVLRQILSDEIKHARAGWAHLSSGYVTEAMKLEISHHVPDLIKASLTSLIDENSSIPTEEWSAWGLPSVDAARAHADKAIREIVVPGFDRLGISVSAQ